MIPCKLTLKNFLSYGEQVPPLDLEGIHVACLCGANGNGKSALLDAITWALWGKARESRDDELVRMHRDEMEVTLEFLSGSNRYRVLRRHSRAGRRQAHTELELQLWDGAAFRPITGATVRETQARITETLRLDYDSFVDSAYLVQGQADRFSLKRPAERKELLAKILGLSVYEQLESRAREQARDLVRSVGDMEGRLQGLEGSLAGRAVAQQEHSQARILVAELEAGLKEAQGQVDTLTAQAQAADLKRERLQDLEQQAQRAARELGDLEVQARWHQEQIASDGALAARAVEIAERYAELQAARRDYDALNQGLKALRDLERRQGELERAVQSARVSWERKLAVASSQAQDARARGDRVPELERDLAATRAQRDTLATLERQAQAQADEAAALAAGIQAIQARIEQEGKEITDKLELLAHAQAQCPLCGQELDPDGKASLQRKLEEEQRALREQWKRLEKDIEAKRAAHGTARRSAEALQVRLRRDGPALERRIGSQEKELADARAAQGRADALEQEAGALKGRLDQRDYAAAEQQEAALVHQQIEALGYDPKAQERLRRRGEELAPAEEEHRLLQEAQRRLPEEHKSAQRVAGQAAERRREQAELADRMRQLHAELAAQPELPGQLAVARQELAALQTRHTAALTWRAQVEERLHTLERQAQERDTLATQLAKARDDRLTYELLAQAFGKDGIPAHIIEAAVPEIEAEANRLLARMTDNRMHLDIRTQRERKGGGAIETLEVQVADELGTRAYELFSGGEAFRINFALRIALSKLLARRAGAPLPTLIIDEGFGTQDGAGRERLVDAINAVQDDFQRILVITHLDDIRDAFPVQIEVTKTEEGSMIQVR